MAKRSDTGETLILALELLKRIPKNSYVTTKQLHEQLTEISVVRDIRTIQRHLDLLSEHFNIDRERDDASNNYKYRWNKLSRGLEIPSLTPQESLLLMLAEEYLKNLLPASLLKSMEGFFRQSSLKLSEERGAELEREWLSKVRVVSQTQPLISPEIDEQVFDTVSNALYRNYWLSVEYVNSSGRRAEHKVMPLGLAQQGPRLYLVCRFDGYVNERSLALHRIKSAKALSMLSFKRPEEFDLEKYDSDGRFGFGDGQKVHLSFCIDKGAGGHLLETPLSTDQKCSEYDDCYMIEATVVNSAQLDWWLRGFGDDVWDVEKVAIEQNELRK